MRNSIRVTVSAVVFALNALIAAGQVTTGTPPLSSLTGGPDVVNLSNLNVHITIPILNRAARGANFTYTLNYDSSVWTLYGGSGGFVWQPVQNWGWRGSSEAAIGYITAPSTVLRTCTNGYAFESNQWVYHDQFGTPHPFKGTLFYTTGGCAGMNSGFSSVASDNSGYSIVVTGPGAFTLYSSKGTLINAAWSSPNQPASSVDRNGNEMNTDGLHMYDTQSNTTPVVSVAGSGTPASPYTYSYIAPSGATATYTAKYTSYTVQTNFACSRTNEYGPIANNLVSEVDLPDIGINSNENYTFSYEITPGDAHTPHYVTGRIASVTLPTGGTITYKYTGSNAGITCADGSAAGLERSTPDTGSSAFWNYSRTPETGAAYITTVTDPTPQLNQTLIQFQGNFETQRDIYQGAAPAISTFPIPESTLQTSSLLQEIQTCYNAILTSCTSTAITQPIGQRNVKTLLSGASSWASSQTSQNVFIYDSFGNLKEEDDYDFGIGTVGSLLKKTATTYATLTNIQAFPQQVTITNRSGATISQTVYNYGDTVVATSGTPQHTTPPGSRGNIISAYYYTQGTTHLTKSATYFDTGNVQTETDLNGAQTTYTYGLCGSSFPTNLSEPLSLSRSMVWNCAGSVLTSVTDENGQITSTAYTADPYFWRPNSSSDPSGAVATYTYSGQTQAESNLTIVSGSSAFDQLGVLDGLGRPSLTQIRQSPGSSTFDTTESDYDVAGRPYRVTLPFAAGAGVTSSSAPGTKTTYDSLGRVTGATDGGSGTITDSYLQNDVLVTRGPKPTGDANTKQRQLQYDGLGHLSSVCELTSITGSGSCAQNIVQTGFWTKYTYDPLGHLQTVTQNAQSGSTQSRSFVYDLLGRMTSETQAESGVTTFTYDTDATCGTSNGDLVKRVDALNNVTCYSYDTFHRLTATTYPSGPYASPVTANKYFVYDAATVNSVAMLNAKGQLAEAYTAATKTGTKITDLGFGYSTRGEVSDIYQASPNSSGYYHSTQQYWPNGAIKQLSGLATLPTFTYGVDGEGRIKTVSTSTGQNPLTGVTYNSAGQPLSLSFGSGDSDAFTYDPNTNRMTQYKFNLNAQSFVGNLTWNANDTLATQNITDPFNATDTQNCSYSYDDLARVSNVNCGATWSQTFGFDAFGNITKSGSMSFQPMYSSSTNRMTSLPGFTPTYDANGNVLQDGSHVYTWDAEGKHVSVDGKGVTYDALGRRVEISYPSEFFYLPDGSSVLFKGQVARHGSFVLPGGANADYDSTQGGLFAYYHADHLGSARLVSTPGRIFSSSLAYAPFGEPYAQSSSSTDALFTGVGQEFGLDIYTFPAREYSDQGRWVSPDPAGIASVDATNPQSWNRYVYVLNNPLSMVDPTGLTCVYDDDGALYGDDEDGRGCKEAGISPGDSSGLVDSNPDQVDVQTSNPDASSLFWDFMNGYWNNMAISGTVLVPSVPFGPEASGGAGPTVAWIPGSNTICAGIAAGVQTPATGRAWSVGPLNLGNVNNTKAILKGGSIFAGGQATTTIGLQGQANSSGYLGGATAGSSGIVGGVSYSFCSDSVLGKLTNIIKSAFAGPGAAF